MPVEILMPSAGASMTEGSLVRWAKREGEAVKSGETLFEVETDKALIEVVAETDGLLGKIFIPDGTDGVKVDSVVGLIAVNGENPANMGSDGTARRAPAAQEPPATTHGTATAAPVIHHIGRILASPLARRIAKERGVELSKVQGSGPKGRVLRADVEAAAEAAKVVQVAAAGAELVCHTAPVAAVAANTAYDEIPHTNMRRIIAQRLGEAKRSIPHFYLTVDCRVDALLEIRQKMNQQAGGIKLSVNDFIVKAVALALRRMPACNASWAEVAIRRFHDVDISVAVATPSGLITPIVRQADLKSIGRISTEVKDLVARARDGKLKPEEFQGGGFTISNLGMFGIREFAAIINPPQACILAVGASEQRPVVCDGTLAVATVMTCTLSADHRVVDGAVGAEFLAEFRRLIENPLSLLI